MPKNKELTENETPINFDSPKITKANGHQIDGVFMIISNLMGFASKYQSNADLGAFHRRLATLLLQNIYDETDAGRFAKELLESARDYSKGQSERGKKAMEKRWGNKAPKEPYLAPFPDGTGGNPF